MLFDPFFAKQIRPLQFVIRRAKERPFDSKEVACESAELAR